MWNVKAALGNQPFVGDEESNNRSHVTYEDWQSNVFRMLNP